MNLVSQEVIRALGLTILDSLWQGAAILLVCTLLLWLLRKEAARWRYRVVLLALLAMPVAGAITFSGHFTAPAEESMLAGSYLPLSDTQTSDAIPEELIASNSLIDQWHAWAASNASWVALIWAIGLSVFALRLLGGVCMVRSIRHRALEPQDRHWPVRLQELRASLNIKIPVQLRESVKVHSPIVLGYLKPVIIFPVGLIQGLPTEQVEAILLHELAHVKRQDYLLNLLVSLVQVLYFYHPAFWWLQRQLDNEREYSCDDLVVTRMSGLSLIKALTAVKEFQLTQYSPSLGFASEKNQLLKRVERIVQQKTKTNWLGGLMSMSALLLSFFLMSYSPQTNTEADQLNDAPVESLMQEPNLQLSRDTINVKQAIVELMDKKKFDITVTLTPDDKISKLLKGGKEVSEAELKVYQEAYEQLKVYVKQEAALRMNLQALEAQRLLVEQRQSAIEENTQLAQFRLWRPQARTEEMILKEQLEFIRELEEGIMKQSARSKEQREEFIAAMDKKAKALRQKMRALNSTEQQRALILEMKRIPEQLRKKHRLFFGGNEFDKRKWWYDSAMRENEQRLGGLGGSYNYHSTNLAQLEAMAHLARQSEQFKNPLIVLDGEVKKGWGISDLDIMDRSVMFESIELQEPASVTETKYNQAMKDHDVLVLVATRPGEKGYKRPSLNAGRGNFVTQTRLELQERFSKALIDKVELDELAPNGWEQIVLSKESFLIDGKKQPKKVHKKYLKLYEEYFEEAMPKGQKVTLEN